MLMNTFTNLIALAQKHPQGACASSQITAPTHLQFCYNSVATQLSATLFSLFLFADFQRGCNIQSRTGVYIIWSTSSRKTGWDYQVRVCDFFYFYFWFCFRNILRTNISHLVLSCFPTCLFFFRFLHYQGTYSCHQRFCWGGFNQA